jgi:hypothetical protein
MYFSWITFSKADGRYVACRYNCVVPWRSVQSSYSGLFWQFGTCVKTTWKTRQWLPPWLAKGWLIPPSFSRWVSLCTLTMTARSLSCRSIDRLLRDIVWRESGLGFCSAKHQCLLNWMTGRKHASIYIYKSAIILCVCVYRVRKVCGIYRMHKNCLIL